MNELIKELKIFEKTLIKGKIEMNIDIDIIDKVWKQ